MAKRLMILIGMLAMVLAVAVPALAQGGSTPTGTITVTGVVGSGPGDGGPPVYFVIDEASGQRYFLDNGPGADYSSYEGKRVAVDGVPRTDPNTGFDFLNVSKAEPVQGGGTTGGGTTGGDTTGGNTTTGGDTTAAPSPDRTATLSFELTVKGDPPAGTTFLGFIPAEGGISAPLTDPDGDGVYTGSVDVPKFPPGPAPPGTEPVSLPVQIAQNSGGNLQVIKDFGLVKIDGDKTFRAKVNFKKNGDGTTTPEGTTPEGTIPEVTTPESTTPATGTVGSSDNNAGSGSSGTENGVSAGASSGSAGKSGSGDSVSGSSVSSGGSGSGVSDSGGSVSGGSASGGSGDVSKAGGKTSGGTGPLGIRSLPSTGGMALTILGAGVLLVGGGLLVRRIFR